jgi:hypothetical protein
MGEVGRARSEVLNATSDDDRDAALTMFWHVAQRRAWDDLLGPFEAIAGPLEEKLPPDAPVILLLARIRDAFAAVQPDPIL